MLASAVIICRRDCCIKVLRHYGKQIRFASPENGHINKDTEDSIKQHLVAALFKFRFDEQLYSQNRITAAA